MDNVLSWLQEKTGLNRYVVVGGFTCLSMFFLLLSLVLAWYTVEVLNIKERATLFEADGYGAVKFAGVLLIFVLLGGFVALGLMFKSKQDADAKFMKFAAIVLGVGAAMIFLAFILALTPDICEVTELIPGLDCTKFGAGTAMALIAFLLMVFSTGLALAASHVNNSKSEDVTAKAVTDEV